MEKYYETVDVSQELPDDNTIIYIILSNGDKQTALYQEKHGWVSNENINPNDIAHWLRPVNLSDEKDDVWEWNLIFYGALKELVELKNLKETLYKGNHDGKEYAERKPLAWNAARQAIELWKKSDYGANPLPIEPPNLSTHDREAWVKVEDGLPEVDKHVLVIEKDIFGDIEMSIARRSYDGDWYRPFKDITSSVTHWMNLPEPPSK